MKPIEFKGSNVVFAKDQPEYLPLPAMHDSESGTVTSCWKMTWRERLEVLWHGRLFIATLTFNNPLQPIRPYIGPLLLAIMIYGCGGAGDPGATTAASSPSPVVASTLAPSPIPAAPVCATPPTGITVGAKCAPATPGCGIDEGEKAPKLKAGHWRMVFDASYYLGMPGNKVHAGSVCYPGPIEAWSTNEVRCDVFGEGQHMSKCGPFDVPGRFVWTVEGGGLAGEIAVEVER